MSVIEKIVDVPDRIQHTETIGIGLSSWVQRLNAAAKCYKDIEERIREVTVYDRLGSGHPGIMRCYGTLDHRCLVLEFACHGSVRQYIRDHHKIPLALKLRWMEQTTGAIAFLHSNNIFHCDISSNNVFLDENLDAKVGDFSGSSLDGGDALTWYETTHSHPDLSTPSVQSDIFALGSTFYEISSGKVPFEGMDSFAVAESFRAGRLPSLESLPALGIVIEKCWRQQYHNVDELLQDVKREGMFTMIFPTLWLMPTSNCFTTAAQNKTALQLRDPSHLNPSHRPGRVVDEII